MGIKSKSDKIFEYNVERNEVYQVFQIDQTHSDFAHSVYQSNHIILSGGMDHAVYGKNIVVLFSVQIDPLSLKLSLARNYLPILNVRRAKHSSFILRDHYFVIFGQKDINSFAEFAETLNLRPLFING